MKSLFIFAIVFVKKSGILFLWDLPIIVSGSRHILSQFLTCLLAGNYHFWRPYNWSCWCMLVLPSSMTKPPSMTSISSLSEIMGTSRQSPTAPYIPDFTVRALTDLQYICIRRAHYMVALHATLLERQRRGTLQTEGAHEAPVVTPDDEEDTFTKEWRRAQRVLSVSASGTTRSDTGSIRDDVSVHDITVSQPPADSTSSEVGSRTEFIVGFSPDRHRSGSPSSPLENSGTDTLKERLGSQLFTWTTHSVCQWRHLASTSAT